MSWPDYPHLWWCWLSVSPLEFGYTIKLISKTSKNQPKLSLFFFQNEILTLSTDLTVLSACRSNHGLFGKFAVVIGWHRNSSFYLFSNRLVLLKSFSNQHFRRNKKEHLCGAVHVESPPFGSCSSSYALLLLCCLCEPWPYTVTRTWGSQKCLDFTKQSN